MNLLALDASTPVCPVAAGLQGGPSSLESTTTARSNQASEDLDQRLAAALDTLGSLDAVACGRGPGTFTGIRVALATAMGLALGRDLPLYTFSSLAALAASAGVGGRVVAALDARRGEVYLGRFEVDLDSGAIRALAEERCLPGSGTLPEGDHHVGSGFDVHAAELSDFQRRRHHRGVTITPGGIWIAANAAVEQTDPRETDPALARAVYLRRSYAELGLNRPRQAVYRSPFVES